MGRTGPSKNFFFLTRLGISVQAENKSGGRKPIPMLEAGAEAKSRRKRLYHIGEKMKRAERWVIQIEGGGLAVNLALN